jgi:hypothetical protein
MPLMKVIVSFVGAFGCPDMSFSEDTSTSDHKACSYDYLEVQTADFAAIAIWNLYLTAQTAQN